MQNEDETNVPTGDELFEQPAEFAVDDDGAMGRDTSKMSSGHDAQGRHNRSERKLTGGKDAQKRRN
jgi:hypothetical protein